MRFNGLELLAAQAVVIVMFVVVSMAVSSFLWPYSLNEWLLYTGKEPTVHWWHGAIIGILPPLGFISIPLALITFVFMLFL